MQLIANRFVVDEKTKPYQGEMAEVLCAFDSANSMQKVAVKLFKGIHQSKLIMEAFARECESLAACRT